MSVNKPERALAIALGVLSISAISWWAVSSASASRTPASEVLSSPANSGVNEAVQNIRFHPEKGSRYTYSFERTLRITGLKQHLAEIHYEGNLFIDVIRASSSSFDAWVSDQVIPEQADAPSLKFKIHVDASGKTLELSALEPKNEIEKQYSGVLKDLLANWVFPLDSDTFGAYQSRYEPTMVIGSIARIRKHKIAYLKDETGTRSRAVTPKIDFSEHVADWDLQMEMPREISGREISRVASESATAPADQALSFSSEAGYKLVFVGVSAIPSSSAGMSEEGYRSETLALTPGSPAARASAKFTTTDWPKLLARIAQYASLSSADQLAVFGDLAAFLRAQTGGVASVMGLLSNDMIAAGPSSPLFKLAVGALATAGTPEAQAALLQIYEDPACTTAGKGSILAALTTTQAQLTAQTRDFLLSETQSEQNADLANGAVWALGSSLQSAPQSGDASAGRAIASIQQAWSQSVATESEQLSLLDAMGNSGRSEFLPILSGVISTTDDDLSLRSKAVYALRFMRSSDAVTILDQSLSDPNTAIRLAAADAMQVATWNPSFQAPLSQCASSDSAAQVQSACQQALKNAGS